MSDPVIYRAQLECAVDPQLTTAFGPALVVTLDEYNRVYAKLQLSRAEALELRERVAFLESPEVCAAAHDDVQECGYCQRDRYYPGYIRYEYLRTLSVRAIAQLWASSFMPSGLPLDEMVDRARAAHMKKA
jgi:hypothetical protein